MNKKLAISIPIFIVTMVSVVVTLAIINNNKEPVVDPNLNPVDSGMMEESESIDLQPDGEAETEEKELSKLFVTIGDERKEVALEDNSTAVEFLKRMPMELTMNDLNNNEKYAYLDEKLPTNEYRPEIIEVGDVMLYGDNCLVVFYETFETDYRYTKIGFIDGLPEMGDGDAMVRFEAE